MYDCVNELQLVWLSLALELYVPQNMELVMYYLQSTDAYINIIKS